MRHQLKDRRAKPAKRDRWFAWFPVVALDRRCGLKVVVWLETVDRSYAPPTNLERDNDHYDYYVG